MSRYPACWRCWRRSRTRAKRGPAVRRWCSCWRSRWCASWPGRRASGRSATRPLTCRRSCWRALGGQAHPLRRAIAAPSEKRIRTLIQELDAAALDVIIGGWLRALAVAGRLERLLTAIAIDGKWLRGVADGQVKLFAAMLHDEKVMIGQHRIPDDTNEITQVRELLDAVDLGCVVTADAAHAQHDTAEYIAGEREADYALTVKGNQPGLQRAIYDKVTADCGTAPDHVDIDCSHGRIVKRSIWVTNAEGIDFPHADQV